MFGDLLVEKDRRGMWHVWERRVAYRVLVERPEERRPLGKRKSRLEGNNKMDLSEVRRGVDCIDLDQDRDRWRAFVNLEINLPVL
jgi:hypothetical protein